MNKILNTRTEVSSSCPDIFNESNLFGINFEFFSKPSVVKLNTLIFEKDKLVGFVENLNTNHHKSRVMSTGQSNVVQIVESKTELRADQRICRWIHLSCDAIRLEAKDSCSYIINIISPTSYNRITIYFCTRNSSSCKRSFK